MIGVLHVKVNVCISPAAAKGRGLCLICCLTHVLMFYLFLNLTIKS